MPRLKSGELMSEIVERAHEWIASGPAALEAFDEGDEFSPALLAALGSEGFLAVTLNAEFGGGAASHREFAELVEIFSARATALGFQITSSCAATTILQEYASKDLAASIIPRVAAGELFTCDAITEPVGGSSISALNTRARRDGDAWVIDGRKAMAAWAGVADIFLVTAATDAGPSIFLIEAGAEGLEIKPRYDFSGVPQLSINPVILNAVRTPENHLIGQEGQAAKMWLHELVRTGRLGLAAIHLGIARAAFDKGIERARRRFDAEAKRPDSRDAPLAFVDRELTAARLLLSDAADRADRNAPMAELLRGSAMAKWAATDISRRASRTVMELQGAWGSTKSRGLIQRLADATDLAPGAGSDDVMAMTILRSRLN